MDEIERAHAAAVQTLVAAPGRIFVVGGMDSGKTTFCARVARAAVQAGHVAAVVDADLAQSTIGPPSTVGLRIFRTLEDTAPEAWGRPDAMAFVGGVAPRGNFLPLVTGTAKLVMRAIEMGARLIVVDTSGLIAGVAGQILKLMKAELCRPHHVVAIAQGGELDPIVGVLRRFLSVQVMALTVHPDIRVRPVDERLTYQEKALAAFLGPEVHRWRVKPTVFMPSLPPDFDLNALEGLLVGVDNGHGDCLGLGILECREDSLRLLTPVAEGVKALRLGSVRVTPQGTITGRVDIPAMFDGPIDPRPS
ncbi:MAG TPA: Clp1/GlmU family protein [Actinomycetota bacterium]|nr:Clp1/GlmU family protein [Actinomycetota bacterium]